MGGGARGLLVVEVLVLLVVAVVLRALHDVGLWAEFLFLLRAVVWSGWLACRRLCRQGLGTWLGSC